MTDQHAGQPWDAHRRALVRNAVGVGVAAGTYGVSFGAVATATGLSVPQACALSVLMFTGASQFALVSVVGAGGGALAAAATALLLGSRNGLYAVSLAPVLEVRGVRRLVAAQLVIDESTAMSVAQPERHPARLAFWVTGLSVFLLWNAATLLGALAGQALPDPRALGLDAAAPAAFVALLAPRLTTGGTRRVAGAAAVVVLLLTPVVPAGVPILGVAALTCLLGLRRVGA